MRRRAETNTSSGVSRGRTLISIRTSQRELKMEGAAGNRGRAELPRSFSTPSRNTEYETTTSEKDRSCIMRSYSTPEPKREPKRECDPFFRPQICESRDEPDPERAQFEDPILDVDADTEQTIFGSYRHSPKRDELKKVTASLLPGSGLHRVAIRPITTKDVLTRSQDNKKEKHGKRELLKVQDRLNSRPLMLKIPVPSLNNPINVELPSSSVEELQMSPLIDMEGAILEQELKTAEQHMEKEVAIATEESDGDTLHLSRGRRPALITSIESTVSRGVSGTVPVVAERVIDKRPGPAAELAAAPPPCTVGVVQHFRADNGTGAGLESNGCPRPNNERALTLGAHGRRGAGRDGAMTPARAARGPAFGCDPPRTPSA